MEHIMKPDTSPPSLPFYSIPVLAKEDHVSEKSVRRWINNGDLIAHLFGNLLRVSASDKSLFERTRRGANLAGKGVQ